MRYYHAPSAAGGSTSYSLYDEVVFTRHRSDGLVTTSDLARDGQTSATV
jgi:hypothetical protein